MRFVTGFFVVIGVLVVLAIAAVAGVFVVVHSRGTRIADGTVLTMDLTVSLPDTPPGGGLSQIVFPSGMSLVDALGALERAGDDPRVKGLVARIGDADMSIAEVQELRDAIKAFRAKGKHAVAYTDTFGELGSGTSSYYLAAAFDEIWLQPMGMVGLVGLGIEMPYFRGTLDMLDIVPDFEHREEFKDAANVMTEKDMTAPEREELSRLLSSIFGQIVDGIAADRKLGADQVKALIDRAPLMASEALDAHLIDHVGDREAAFQSFGSNPPVATLDNYLDAVGKPHDKGPTVALIYATGLIARGGGGGGGPTSLFSAGGTSTDELIRAFRLAREDPDVRVILFRIDSPGGSAVAAETIWDAVQRARAAGKKVIVSMGDLAGSGGYYIAAPADTIVAEPATLTGSIGVVAGKIVFGGLAKKLGANFADLGFGANATMFSNLQDFSDSERARLNAVLDDVYAGFKQRVADGRKLDADAVEAIAKGRVWSGEDAKSNHLVDRLGGFETALDLAKQAAGVPAGGDVTLKLYPPAKSTVGTIVSRLTGETNDSEDDTVLPSSALAFWRANIEGIALLLAPPGALTMPPLTVR